mgnify:CR=1 FL=1
MLKINIFLLLKLIDKALSLCYTIADKFTEGQGIYYVHQECGLCKGYYSLLLFQP